MENDDTTSPATSVPPYGCTPKELFESRIGIEKGYTVVAPFGGGKSCLARKEAKRIAKEAKQSNKPTLLIVCLWWEEFAGQIQNYEKFAKTLPKGDDLEVKVFTKKTLCEEYNVICNNGRTSEELNDVCKAIEKIETRDVYIVADEVTVEQTPPRTARQFAEAEHNPNKYVGYIPFVHNGAIYSWVKLNPRIVRLLLYVTPECGYLKDQAKITLSPPEEGPVPTFFMTNNLRTTQMNHMFLKFMEQKLETSVSDYPGYLLPPNEEGCFNKREGHLPEWIDIQETEHIMCETGCKSCLLHVMRPSLAANLREIEEFSDVERSNIAMVIIGTSSDKERDGARDWMREQFPEVAIKTEGELHGSDMKVVISIGNFNSKNLMSMIPFSLSRATDRLYIFGNDYREIFKTAVQQKIIKKRDDLSILSKEDLEPKTNSLLRKKNMAKLEEVLPIVVSQAWDMSPEAIEQLAVKIGQETTYRNMMASSMETTRGDMVEFILKEWILHNEGASLLRLKVALRAETVRLDRIAYHIDVTLRENLKAAMVKLTGLVKNYFFTRKNLRDLAFQFGLRQRHRNFIENKKNPMSEMLALVRCLDVFVQHAPSDFSPQDMVKVLLQSDLPKPIKDEVIKLISAAEDSEEVVEKKDDSSDIGLDPVTIYEMSGLDVAFPLITLITTALMMVLWMAEGLPTQAGILTALMFLLPMGVMFFHIMEQVEHYALLMTRTKLIATVLFIPVTQIVTFMEILFTQAKIKGNTMRKYHLYKLMKTARTLKQTTCFSSLTAIIFILILFNEGNLVLDWSAVSVVSVTAGIFHFLSLIISIMRSWTLANAGLTPLLLLFPLVSSFILRILPAVLLTSGAFSPMRFIMIPYSFLILIVNYLLEKKMMNSSDLTAIDDVIHKPITWIKAAISCLFPVPPKNATTRSLQAVNGQLFVANLTSLVVIYLAANIVPVPSSWLFPQNLIKSLSITSTCLMLHATVSFAVSTHILKEDDIEVTMENDDDNESREDVTEISSAPLIRQENITEDNRNKWKDFLIATWAVTSATLLLAAMATAPALMLKVFNNCPPLVSLNRYSNISCDGPIPVVGTSCQLSCVEGYPSIGSLHSKCAWTGMWSNTDMGCSTTSSLLLVGRSFKEDDGPSTAEVFYPSGVENENHTISAFPYHLTYGTGAYFNGKAMICGGYDGLVKSSCYTLQKDGKWVRAPDIPQARVFASAAVISRGSTIWILGGADNDRNLLSSTIMLESSSSRWTDGPPLTSPRAGHCCVTMSDGDVVIAGGGDSNGDALTLVERFSLRSGEWRTEAPLHHARSFHSCSHVWLEDWGEIALDTGDAMSGVVVAGGYTVDNSGARHEVTSVELLLGQDWIQLPQLPDIRFGPMSLPTSIMWFPGLGLRLVGGCYYNWHDITTFCTTKVWNLAYDGGDAPNIKYHWVIQNGKLEIALRKGNCGVYIPSTFFN